MPAEKPLTVLTYAASASLAAIALVYFFNPNYLLDSESSGASASARKKGVVGLSNPMNDCFINSVLQSLAGLRELRLYLIRELYRRKRGGEEVYKSLPERKEGEKPVDARKMLSLQSGEVTQGLKDILDGLNERPLQRKTISAAGFIAVLEHAFETRISKAQQDAQELLQVIAERLCDEYHAAKEARKRARAASESEDHSESMDEPPETADEPKVAPKTEVEEAGLPLEGRTEAQIECQHCHFIPKPHPVPFVTLTLSVPQKSSTTLDECFDGHFKREFIDDYKCDRCRLDHAIALYHQHLTRATDPDVITTLHARVNALERARDDDPEKPPAGVPLPDIARAPARRIARHVAVTRFPRVLAVHLSRSMFDVYSAKNTARVAFPERLTVGGLLRRRQYRLLGVVTHKGTHNSGHYESFRRQHVYPPVAMPTPTTTPAVSPRPPPAMPAAARPSSPIGVPGRRASPAHDRVSTERSASPPTPASTPSSLDPSEVRSSTSTRPSSFFPPSKRQSLRSPLGSEMTTPTLSSTAAAAQSPVAAPAPLAPSAVAVGTPPPPSIINEDAQSRRDSSATQRFVDSVKPRGRRKKGGDAEASRWWRISDDKVRECRTADVLAMQKEVYLLFYEMEADMGKAG